MTLRRALSGFAVLTGAALGLALLAAPRSPEAPADRPLPVWDQPDRPARIVAFGTSLTASNPWPDHLQTRLTACLGREVEVIRVARNNRDSDWGTANFDRVLAARPDTVLMEFAINDADIKDGMRPSISRERTEALLDRIATELPGTQVMLMTMNPVTGPRQRLQRFWLEGYYALYRDIAAERDLALADLTPRWHAAWAADPGLVPEDGLHPTEAATTQVVLPVVAEALGRAAGQAGCGTP